MERKKELENSLKLLESQLDAVELDMKGLNQSRKLKNNSNFAFSPYCYFSAKNGNFLMQIKSK